MKSIQTKLTLWLIAALVFGSIIALAATYFFARAELRRVFDHELRQIAQAVHLREDWRDAGRIRIARPGFLFSVRAYDETGRIYFETVQPALPQDVPQTVDDGFTFVDTAEGAWRLYTYVTPEGIVQVGQPVATRVALARDLSLLMLFPLLVLVSLLAVSFSWVLKRGLVPLTETSRLVRDRDASRLDALPTENVPAELLPLVQQINALFQRVAASFDGQRRFLADVAHELRSPVTALTLQVQQVERAATTAARATALEELKRGIARTRRLVQQLLAFARLEAETPSELRKRVNIADLVRDVVGSYAVQAEECGVDLGADAPAVTETIGDESELRSMIANLIDNALRYTPENGAVTVAVCERNSTVELLVVDEGPGIPGAERERVFERFYRMPGDRTPGSGLGLAIVKAIVERHRGTVTLVDAKPCAEQPGLGVRISLPAALDNA